MTGIARTSALPPFDRVVDEHGPAVLRFCVSRVGPELAEDCFQLTMLERPDDELWGRVAGLPDKQRHAVALRFIADLSHREIGEAMDTSEAAARRNVHEALRSL